MNFCGEGVGLEFWGIIAGRFLVFVFVGFVFFSYLGCWLGRLVEV